MKKRIVSIVLAVTMLFGIVGLCVVANAESEPVTVCNGEVKPHSYQDGVCTECGAVDENVRLYLGVTMGGTVDAIVNDQYDALLRLPEDGKMNTALTTVKGAFQFGEEKKNFSMTLNTEAKLGNQDIDLTETLANLYDFGGSVVCVSVAGKEVSYEISAYENGKISATADFSDAEAVWQEVGNYVAVEQQEENLSQIVLANGSFVKIGTNCLHFTEKKGDFAVTNFLDVDGLHQLAKDTFTWDTCEDQGNTITLYVKKGTKLAIGQNAVTMKKGCVVQVTVPEVSNLDGLKAMVEDLKTSENQDAFIEKASKLLNEVFDMADLAEQFNVSIEFLDCLHEFRDGICDACGEAEENVKFYAGVTSDDTVDAIVTDDYQALIRLPENGKMSTEGFVFNVLMQDIASLKVEGVKKSATVLNTEEALGKQEIDLTQWFANAYAFDGGKIVATVNTKPVTYNFSAYKNGKIAVATDAEKAAAAWAELASNIKAEDATAEQAVIANGSYIKVGTEYLHFTAAEGNLVLKDFADVAGLKKSLDDALTLEACADQGKTVTIFVKAGTQLVLADTCFTLNEDCTVKFVFDTAAEAEGLFGALTDVKEATTANAFVEKVAALLNRVVGVLDGADKITAEIECGFCDHKLQKTVAKEATCISAGNHEYYTCRKCLKVFKADKVTLTTVEAETIPALVHNPEKVEAKEATFFEDGNSEYWVCHNCNKYYSDAAGTHEIAKDSWVISAKLSVNNEADGTKRAQITFEDGNKTMVVTCDLACIVLAKNGSGAYTELTGTKRSEGVYTFDLSSVSDIVQVLVILKGDVNMDGEINSTDVLSAAAVANSKKEADVLESILLNTNGDAQINSTDVLQIAAAANNKRAMTW